MKKKLLHRLIRLIFHPLLVGCYALIIMIVNNTTPFYFISDTIKLSLIESFVYVTFILPMMLILILRWGQYISSLSDFPSKELRMILLTVSIFYIIALIILSPTGIPQTVIILPVIAIVTIIITLFFSYLIKINIHTIAISALIIYLLFYSIVLNNNLLPSIIIAILSWGIINYSFLETKTSTPKELSVSTVLGFFIMGISIFLL